MAKSMLGKFMSIDMKRISPAGAEVLAEIKHETKNFTKVPAALRAEFNALYDKLLEKKPYAIKGTSEYEAYGKKRKLKGATTPKTKTTRGLPKDIRDKYKGKGVDIEKDSTRQAKPFGARVRGEGIYRKPTKKDYENDDVYYEYRANRADVRRKYPKLKEGGELGYQSHISEHHRTKK